MNVALVIDVHGSRGRLATQAQKRRAVSVDSPLPRNTPARVSHLCCTFDSGLLGSAVVFVLFMSVSWREDVRLTSEAVPTPGEEEAAAAAAVDDAATVDAPLDPRSRSRSRPPPPPL